MIKLSQSDTKKRPKTGERLERSAGRGVRRRGRIFSGVESAETTGVPIGKTCQRLSSGCFFGSFLVNTRNERPRQGARPIPRQKPNFFKDFVRTVVGQASIMHPAFGTHIHSNTIRFQVSLFKPSVSAPASRGQLSLQMVRCLLRNLC